VRHKPVLIAALAATLAAIVSTGAHAAYFPGDAVDGPPAQVLSLGDLDLARDGTGAVAYTRRIEDGTEHAFVSRFEAGTFRPLERVDASLPGSTSHPVVGAADGGRLVVAFVNGGTVYGLARPSGDQSFLAPVALGPGTDPSVDLSINGTAYASFTSAGDVRVARLDRRSNAWTVLPQPADVDPAREAGVGSGRSRVTISADGIGVVAWGEAGHVFARKMSGTALSNGPQDLTPADFEGRAATTSDLPDLDAEDDSSYAWVVFRQSFAEGGPRILARRQRGTGFDPPVAVDAAAGEPINEPRIDLNGRGRGIASATGSLSGQPMAAVLERDVFGAGARLFFPSAVPARTAPAMSDNNDGLIAAVVAGAGEAPYVRVLPFDDGKPQPETVVSRPQLGPVAPELGFDAAIDRAGGVVMAWVQGEPGARRLVAAYYDRPPLSFVGNTYQRCCVGPLPRLSWQPAFDLWGTARYQVLVDGKIVGETTDTRLQLTVPLTGPSNMWQVRAIDVRGQMKRTRRRLLRVDDVSPRLSVRYKRNKRVVTLSARSRDPNPSGHRASGIASTVVSWGDSGLGESGAFAVHATHRYPRKGTFKLKIQARDKAGNKTISQRTVRIR